MLASLAATAFTTLLLLMLCLGDPKRLRAARLPGTGHSITVRRATAAAALLPGLGLALSGQAAAFLIWLGGSMAAGWIVTICLSQARPNTDRQ